MRYWLLLFRPLSKNFPKSAESARANNRSWCRVWRAGLGRGGQGIAVLPQLVEQQASFGAGGLVRGDVPDADQGRLRQAAKLDDGLWQLVRGPVAVFAVALLGLGRGSVLDALLDERRDASFVLR